ncbi:MAG: PQQ-binding-like beta-propeller repeat protein [Chloroflexota bacterium]|nr:PQQ-binding-like beta-propeller repeat protein [Chloroflexota bacterium]
MTHLSRRRCLEYVGQWLALGGAGLLAACQSPQPQITVPAPTQAPTARPPLQPAASPSPAAAASPSPVAGAAVAGKPMYQMDARHTGRSPHTGPRRLTVLRSFNSGDPAQRPSDPLVNVLDVQSSTAIGPDGTIYATNYFGWLFALKDSSSSSNSLDLAWRFRPPNASPFHGTPALSADGRTVYVAFTTRTGDVSRVGLFAVRAPASGQDGQVVWQTDVGEAPAIPAGNSPTLGPDGTLYYVNALGLLSALDSNSGNLRWTVQTGNGQAAQFGQTVKVAPAVGPDGTVYTTALTGSLFAVSPPAGSGSQGSIKWTFNFSEHLGPTPLISAPVTGPPNRGQDAVGSGASATIGPDGTIYVGANNSNFYAVDPNGQQRWLYEAERELAGIWTTAALSADSSVLFFGANKGGIYALATRDGTLRWQYPVYGSIYASPALDSRGTLYAGTTSGQVLALDSSNGDLLAAADAGQAVWSAPSIRPDGRLVTADRSGKILLLGET